jgi:hypothetical protein
VDGGIAFAQACGARALHNTIAFTSPPFAASEWRFKNSEVDLINNLTTHYLVDRGGSAADIGADEYSHGSDNLTPRFGG